MTAPETGRGESAVLLRGTGASSRSAPPSTRSCSSRSRRPARCYDAQVVAAKRVCAGCPVRPECLTEALVRIPYGIAGGLTEDERRTLAHHRWSALPAVERAAATRVGGQAA